MRLIDERYLAAPFHGSRRMPAWLGRRGEAVNRKRVQRRMRIMGLEAIHPGPRTTVRNPDHEIHRYLLRGVAIDRRDQVWSIDVTYLPPEDGDMFPAAVIDRHSRFALRGGVRTGESVGRFVKQRWAGRYGASTGA